MLGEVRRGRPANGDESGVSPAEQTGRQAIGPPPAADGRWYPRVVGRWVLEGLIGAALAVLAIAVGQLATRGAVTDWTILAAAAAASFVLYPVLARRQRRR